MAFFEHQQLGWPELWDNFRKGDISAFEKIHKAFYTDLFRYALKLQQDEGLAEDAVQELFLKLWKKRSTLGAVSHVKAYLLKALRNIILNELRSLKLREMKIRFYHQPDIAYSAEDILMEKERQHQHSGQVAAILNALSKRQREFIYLRYFEELDYREISSVLGINYQSVLNLSQRILRYMRTIYQER